jgi:hypothetical protein
VPSVGLRLAHARDAFCWKRKVCCKEIRRIRSSRLQTHFLQNPNKLFLFFVIGSHHDEGVDRPLLAWNSHPRRWRKHGWEKTAAGLALEALTQFRVSANTGISYELWVGTSRMKRPGLEPGRIVRYDLIILRCRDGSGLNPVHLKRHPLQGEVCQRMCYLRL